MRGQNQEIKKEKKKKEKKEKEKREKKKEKEKGKRKRKKKQYWMDLLSFSPLFFFILLLFLLFLFLFFIISFDFFDFLFYRKSNNISQSIIDEGPLHLNVFARVTEVQLGRVVRNVHRNVDWRHPDEG